MEFYFRSVLLATWALEMTETVPRLALAFETFFELRSAFACFIFFYFFSPWSRHTPFLYLSISFFFSRYCEFVVYGRTIPTMTLEKIKRKKKTERRSCFGNCRYHLFFIYIYMYYIVLIDTVRQPIYVACRNVRHSGLLFFLFSVFHDV